MPNLHMLVKQKTPSLIRNLALGTFGELQIVPSIKVNLPYLLCSTGLEELSSASGKANLLSKNFSKNSNLNDSGIFLPVFPSRTDLKLHISITPKMDKKVITNLDSSKASGIDCIPVVVLKNCEPEVLCILAELFSMCLKESCFPDCLKISSVVPVFKNVGERSNAKNYHPVSLLSMVSKVFEKLVNTFKKTTLWPPFYGWGSTTSRLEPLRGGSLIFTTKFPDIPDNHFTDLGRMKG